MTEGKETLIRWNDKPVPLDSTNPFLMQTAIRELNMFREKHRAELDNHESRIASNTTELQAQDARITAAEEDIAELQTGGGGASYNTIKDEYSITAVQVGDIVLVTAEGNATFETKGVGVQIFASGTLPLPKVYGFDHTRNLFATFTNATGTFIGSAVVGEGQGNVSVFLPSNAELGTYSCKVLGFYHAKK